MDNLIGQRLGQYEITALLGKGGMATVYRAWQASIEREVAIKVIHPYLVESGDFAVRFQREARLAASLRHPHILKVFDYGQHDHWAYLVTELLAGGSLADRLQHGPLSPDATSRILEQIASGLDYAHDKGILHRDLKPPNVLLDEMGSAYLTDFGIARILSETTALTQSGLVIGTPSYMPPEQWQGKVLDARADIYALGITLFEMLTGKLPFTADTPATMMYLHLEQPPPSLRLEQPELPEAVEAVIQKALAKKAADRFSSALEMAFSFKAALDTRHSPLVGIPLSSSLPDTYPPLMSTTISGTTNVPAGHQTGAIRRLLPGLVLFASLGIVVLLVARSVLIPPIIPTPAMNAVAFAETPIPALALSPSNTPRPVLTVTASPTRRLETTVVPPSATTAPTQAPTLDVFAAAQSTNIVESTVNAVRTQLFIQAQTATAKNWTAIPTATLTFTPSPTVPSLTPSITFTASLTPTPGVAPTLTPIPAGLILFQEDFESGSLDSLNSASENWQVVTDDTGNKVLDGSCLAGCTGQGMDFGSMSWTDYAIEYRIKFLNKNTDVNVNFRNTPLGNYVQRLSLKYQNIAYYMSPKDKGWTGEATRGYSFKQGVWYSIRIEAQGSMIRFFANDKLILQKTDAQFSAGAVNFSLFQDSHVQYDDIKVTTLGKPTQ